MEHDGAMSAAERRSRCGTSHGGTAGCARPDRAPATAAPVVRRRAPWTTAIARVGCRGSTRHRRRGHALQGLLIVPGRLRLRCPAAFERPSQTTSGHLACAARARPACAGRSPGARAADVRPLMRRASARREQGAARARGLRATSSALGRRGCGADAGQRAATGRTRRPAVQAGRCSPAARRR